MGRRAGERDRADRRRSTAVWHLTGCLQECRRLMEFKVSGGAVGSRELENQAELRL